MEGCRTRWRCRRRTREEAERRAGVVSRRVQGAQVGQVLGRRAEEMLDGDDGAQDNGCARNVSNPSAEVRQEVRADRDTYVAGRDQYVIISAITGRCGCGIYAVGACAVCDRPVCGKHGASFNDVFLCGAHLREREKADGSPSGQMPPEDLEQARYSQCGSENLQEACHETSASPRNEDVGAGPADQPAISRLEPTKSSAGSTQAAELVRALGLKVENSRNLEHAYSAARAFRLEAMKRYDMGYRDSAAAMYREAIVSFQGAFNTGQRSTFLSKHESSLKRGFQYIAENPEADVWKLRMVLDDAIEYLHALLLIQKVREYSDSRRFGYMGNWEPFEPLRYSIEPRDGYEFRSFDLICDVCAEAMNIQEKRLAEQIQGKSEPDLEEAVILRILRWPTLSLTRDIAEPTYRSSRRKLVSNPVAALWDVYYLDMINFSPDSFLQWAIDQIGRDLFLQDTPRVTFDKALGARGYPRDSAFWGGQS